MILILYVEEKETANKVNRTDYYSHGEQGGLIFTNYFKSVHKFYSHLLSLSQFRQKLYDQ